MASNFDNTTPVQSAPTASSPKVLFASDATLSTHSDKCGIEARHQSTAAPATIVEHVSLTLHEFLLLLIPLPSSPPAPYIVAGYFIKRLSRVLVALPSDPQLAVTQATHLTITQNTPVWAKVKCWLVLAQLATDDKARTDAIGMVLMENAKINCSWPGAHMIEELVDRMTGRTCNEPIDDSVMAV